MSNLAKGQETDLRLIDRYWRAANYLSVGQIYLLDNPLLRERLRPDHIKPRLLGHWGTTPGLNFIYAHLNRLHPEIATRLDLERQSHIALSRNGCQERLRGSQRQHENATHTQVNCIGTPYQGLWHGSTTSFQNA